MFLVQDYEVKGAKVTMRQQWNSFVNMI